MLCLDTERFKYLSSKHMSVTAGLFDSSLKTYKTKKKDSQSLVCVDWAHLCPTPVSHL